MKKFDNFSSCLNILKNADFAFAESNDIYRTGIVGQFNLTFELAWKALQEVLRLHGAAEGERVRREKSFSWAISSDFWRKQRHGC